MPRRVAPKRWPHVVNTLNYIVIPQGHGLCAEAKYPDALSCYFRAMGLGGREPLLLLCCGAAYLALACERRCADRGRAVLLGNAFMQVGNAFNAGG